MDIFDEAFAIDTGIFIEVILISASNYMWKCTVVKKLSRFKKKKKNHTNFLQDSSLFDLILW